MAIIGEQLSGERLVRNPFRKETLKPAPILRQGNCGGMAAKT